MRRFYSSLTLNVEPMSVYCWAITPTLGLACSDKHWDICVLATVVLNAVYDLYIFQPHRIVWYGMVWYGMVWYGIVSYRIVSYHSPVSMRTDMLTHCCFSVGPAS